MNDIDERIARLLNESIDAELGPQRPAPEFRPPVSARTRWLSRGPTWALPLVAVACVAAIAGGTLAVVEVASSGPATHLPASTGGTSPKPSLGQSAPVAPSTRRSSDSVPASRSTAARSSRSSSSPPSTGSGAPTGTHASSAPRDSTPPASSSSGITFGGVGLIRLGMTASQVRRAAPRLVFNRFGSPPRCTQFYDRSGAQGGGPFLNVLLTPPTDRVVGISAPAGVRTDTGLGVGSSASAVRRAYAGHRIDEQGSQGGPVLLVRGPSSWLGFTLGANREVRSIAVGSHDYAAGYELCVGGASS